MDEKIMRMLSQLIEGQNEAKKQISELTALIEETQRHVKLVGEGLGAFREQVGRQFEEVHASLDDQDLQLNR